MIIDDLRRADPAPGEDVPVIGIPDAVQMLALIDERNQPMATTQLNRPKPAHPPATPPRRRLVAAVAAFIVAVVGIAVAVSLFYSGDDVASTTTSDSGLSATELAQIEALAVEWSTGDLARFEASVAPEFTVPSGPFTTVEVLDQLRFDVVLGQEIDFFECEKVISIICRYRADNALLAAAGQLQPIQAESVRIAFNDAGLVVGFSASVGLEPMRQVWADFVRWLEERAPEDAALMGDWHTQTISQSPSTLGADVAAIARPYLEEYAAFVSSQ